MIVQIRIEVNQTSLLFVGRFYFLRNYFNLLCYNKQKMYNDNNQREEEYEYIKKAKVEVVQLGKEYIFGDSSSSQSQNPYNINSNSNSYIADQGSEMACQGSYIGSQRSQMASQGFCANILGSNSQKGKKKEDSQNKNQQQQIEQNIGNDLIKYKDDHKNEDVNQRIDKNILLNDQPQMQAIEKQNKQREQIIQDIQNKNRQMDHINQRIGVADNQNDNSKGLQKNLQQLISVNNVKTIQYVRALESKIDDLSKLVKEETILREQWTEDFSNQLQVTMKRSIKQKIEECYSMTDKQQKEIKNMTAELSKKMFTTDKRLDNLDKKMDKLIELFSSKRR